VLERLSASKIITDGCVYIYIWMFIWVNEGGRARKARRVISDGQRACKSEVPIPEGRGPKTEWWMGSLG
jgi:hypothetical protein